MASLYKKKCIGLIFTFPVSRNRKYFLTHIPIRIKQIQAETARIFVFYSGYLDTENLRKNDIVSVYLGGLPVYWATKFLFPLILFFKVLVYSNRYDIDIFMNVNNHRWMLPVALACRLRGKKSVARIAGDILHAVPEKFTARLKHFWYRILEKLSLLAVDKIICLSFTTKDIIIKRTGVEQKKVEVFSGGLNTQKFRPLSKKSLPNCAYNRLIFIGRLEPIKGLRFAFNALEMLFESGYKIEFDLFGSGSDEAYLKEKFGNLPGVNFHGEIGHDEVPIKLSLGGILLLPSMFEGFGHVVLEAMGCGVPVIASDVGDMSNFLDNGKNGVLIRYGDSEQLKSAVIKLVEDRVFRDRCIYNALTYVRKNHSVEVLKDKYNEFFNEM